MQISPEVQAIPSLHASPSFAGAPTQAPDEQISPASGCVVSELGAAIGAHTGPGVLGVVVCPVDR